MQELERELLVFFLTTLLRIVWRFCPRETSLLFAWHGIIEGIHV